jgi:hypothetical protein
MKQNKKRGIKYTEPRRDVQEVVRNYQLEMQIVQSIPKTYYSDAGGMKKK